MMQTNPSISKISIFYHYSLAVCLFIIGAYSPWILYGLLPFLLIVAYGLYRGDFTFSPQPYLYGWLILYVCYAISACVYWDPILSPRRLEYKLSFLIFPLLFSFKPNFKIKLNLVIISFGIGILAASFAGIIKSFLLALNEPVHLSQFLTSNICINHPSYYAAFATIALFGLLLGVKYYYCIPENIMVYAYSGFILIMILLSISLAAISFLIISCLTLVLYLVIAKRKIRLAFIAVFIFSLLTLAALQNRFIRDDFTSSFNSLTSFLFNHKEYSSDKDKINHGDEVRLIMWTVTVQELIKHPMGVGTTRSDATLSEGLNSLGYGDLAIKDINGEIKYNPHNQYLQTGLELGIIPMLCMMIYFLLLIYHGIKSKNIWLSVIVLILTYNCLFESILQRQSGIVGFTFLTCLLLLYSKQQNAVSG